MALIDDARAAAAPNTSVGTTLPPGQQDGPGGADGDPSQDDPNQEDGGGDAVMSQEDVKDLQQKVVAAVPQEQQADLQKIVVAGQKVLYSPETSDMLKEQLQGDEPVDHKLAGGAAGLMALLNQQSKGQIPPALYLPAGAVLLLEIAGVMVEKGDTVTQQNVRDGLDQMSAAVMSKHGATPDQVSQTVGGQPPATQAPSQASASPEPQPAGA